MPSTVVIIGAGGKMGGRAAEKIGKSTSYRVVLCESNAERARALRESGLEVAQIREVIPQADFVIMAVPDALIGPIAHEVAPLMSSRGTLIMLDAAAAYIGDLPDPGQRTFMITHPCHPPFFTEQATPEARQDYFGGTAVQNILVSLISGSEECFQRGVGLCRAIFAPVDKAHRVTPEEFALLEPAMSEIVVATAACWMKASLEAAVDAGVPREAAEAFMAGHARIALAIAFGAEKSPFSDAAQVAIRWGTRELIDPNWKRVFRREVLSEAIRTMIHGVDR